MSGSPWLSLTCDATYCERHMSGFENVFALSVYAVLGGDPKGVPLSKDYEFPDPYEVSVEGHCRPPD